MVFHFLSSRMRNCCCSGCSATTPAIVILLYGDDVWALTWLNCCLAGVECCDAMPRYAPTTGCTENPGDARQCSSSSKGCYVFDGNLRCPRLRVPGKQTRKMFIVCTFPQDMRLECIAIIRRCTQFDQAQQEGGGSRHACGGGGGFLVRWATK